MDQILALLDQMLKSAGFWLPIALIASLIVVQGIKTVLKYLVPYKHKRFRKWSTFGIAYIIGYQASLFFIQTPDAHKWAVFIGLVNPVVYFFLVQYAVLNNRLVLLSLLKMRPLKKQADGELGLDDTQTFFVNKEDENE